MRIPGLKKAKKFLRWLRSRVGNHALILGYHRISDCSSDTYSVCVTPQHFGEHLAVLQRVANPISLQDLIEGLRSNSIPPRAVVVTLDDGYADVVTQVAPLLDEYRVPATLFVTTGYEGKLFWWDELDTLLTSREKMPNRAHFPVPVPGPIWGDAGGPSGRKRFVTFVYNQLLSLDEIGRGEALGDLRKWAGIQVTRGGERRALTREELRLLAREDLLTLGGHTVTHPFLAALTEEEQKREIIQNKCCLEDWTGRPVTLFSYPNGSFSETTRRIVKGSGYSGACESFSDVVRDGCDPYSLPRYWVPDWNGPTFSRWLHRWLPLENRLERKKEEHNRPKT